MPTIQTNPAMFSSRYPIYTVTAIDRKAGKVTLHGSDNSTITAELNSWGNTPDTQPTTGTKVQILPD